MGEKFNKNKDIKEIDLLNYINSSLDLTQEAKDSLIDIVQMCQKNGLTNLEIKDFVEAVIKHGHKLGNKENILNVLINDPKFIKETNRQIVLLISEEEARMRLIIENRENNLIGGDWNKRRKIN